MCYYYNYLLITITSAITTAITSTIIANLEGVAQ